MNYVSCLWVSVFFLAILVSPVSKNSIFFLSFWDPHIEENHKAQLVLKLPDDATHFSSENESQFFYAHLYKSIPLKNSCFCALQHNLKVRKT